MLHELAGPGVATRHSIPVPDLTVASDAQIAEAIGIIDRTLAAGAKVYVHCWGGKGRTGTILGCLLARQHGDRALEELNRIRTPQLSHARDSIEIPETEDQRERVRSWPGAFTAPTAPRST